MGRVILPSTARSVKAQNDGFIWALLCIYVLYVLTDYSEHVHYTVCVCDCKQLSVCVPTSRKRKQLPPPRRQVSHSYCACKQTGA